MSEKRTLLVTSALPYANGQLHLGHLVEHIQTDIWVRTHKMLGHDCISLCGVDAHGTPIMLKAEQLGVTPETLTTTIKQSHEKDFSAFRIDYDMYHTTHSEENKLLTQEIYTQLAQRGELIKKTIQQAYDIEKQMFLPDRYVKGTCPRCHTPDQYGDSCEACGATYDPTQLIEPLSVLSGTPPVEKTTEHFFFNLPRHEAFLKTWTREHIQVEMVNKLEEWFEQGLIPWDITRDAPYFGFLIPDTTDKYFYVWLDAPIGYMASCLKYCQQNNLDFMSFWSPDSTTELYHFVGKDILYFHALFWPAVLHASGHRTPTSIFTHGFLTVNGKKMSKSRGTFIQASTYLEHLSPEYLRYYFAAKLNGRTEDLDLNFDDFLNRVNADLIGKVINIASRSSNFIHKYFEGNLGGSLGEASSLYASVLESKPEIIEAYINRDYAKAIRLIMDCTSLVNQYVDQHKPWVLCKDQNMLPQVQLVCTASLNLFRLIIAYLKPVLPTLAEATEAFLQIPPLTFQNMENPLLHHAIQPFVPMLQRVTAQQLLSLQQACESAS